MQLTTYTDYSIRVLVYLALKKGNKATVSEITQFYSVSKHHLVKVVHNLSICGFVNTIRGKGGGLVLSRRPESINLGEVVRHTEKNMNLVECFKYASNSCPLLPTCAFKSVVELAQTRFLDVFSNYTLADIVKGMDQIVQHQSRLSQINITVQEQESRIGFEKRGENEFAQDFQGLRQEDTVISDLKEKYVNENVNLKLHKDEEQEYRGKLNCSALRNISKAEFS